MNLFFVVFEFCNPLAADDWVDMDDLFGNDHRKGKHNSLVMCGEWASSFFPSFYFLAFVAVTVCVWKAFGIAGTCEFLTTLWALHFYAWNSTKIMILLYSLFKFCLAFFYSHVEPLLHAFAIASLHHFIFENWQNWNEHCILTCVGCVSKLEFYYSFLYFRITSL